MARTVRKATFLAKAFQELHDLAKAAEIEQRHLSARLLCGKGVAVVGPTQGNGGVGAIGEAEDHVGISPTADADDLATLPPQGVMGVDNGDESQRRLGQWGSVL